MKLLYFVNWHSARASKRAINPRWIENHGDRNRGNWRMPVLLYSTQLTKILHVSIKKKLQRWNLPYTEARGSLSVHNRSYWLFYTIHTWLISPWFKESFDYSKFLFDLREIRKNSYFYLIYDLMIKQIITINNVDQGNLLKGVDKKNR